MRILGIDYGDSRTGLAISDPLGITAQGLFNIDSKRGNNYVLDELKKVILEYSVEKIVIGYPLNLNGTIGDRAIKTLDFISLLNENFGIEVIKWDERLTTVSAQKLMNEIGTKKSKKRNRVDIIAATYILQGYLDSICKK